MQLERPHFRLKWTGCVQTSHIQSQAFLFKEGGFAARRFLGFDPWVAIPSTHRCMLHLLPALQANTVICAGVADFNVFLSSSML